MTKLPPKPTSLAEHDFSPLRVAMEHLLSHQGIPLEQATACFCIYAVGLAKDHLGPETAQAVLNTAAEELRKKGPGRG